MTAAILSIAAIVSSSCLALASLIQKRQRSYNSLFLAAGLLLLAVIEGADRIALSYPNNWITSKPFALIAESMLCPVWLLYAQTFARRKAFRKLTPLAVMLLIGSLALPLVALISPLQDFFFSPDFAEEQILFLGRTAYWFYLGIICFTIVALYQLERTLLAFSAVERSRVLFEILGVGIILVSVLVFYFQALLHRTIDLNLIPFRSLALLIGTGLCSFSRLRSDSGQGIIVSREVATRSFVVLAVGCYLLLLGGAGQVLSYFGVANQRLIIIVFAVFVGLFLVLLLLSEKKRRKLQVFLSKNFYRHKYDYRNEWLMFTSQLSSANNMDNLQNAILLFYCETFGRKGGALYLKDADSGGYQQRASRFLEFPQTCFFENNALVEYFNETDWVFNSEDQHPEKFKQLKKHFQPFQVKLVVPLLYEEDLEGFILLGEAVNPDETLNFEDFDLMKVLASQATSVLLSSRLSAQLSIAQEMAAIGKVSTFVIHDLKNHVSNLTLMVDNARDHMGNPEFQADMIETLAETIGKVNGLIARLKNIKESTELHCVPCNLLDIAARVAKATGLPEGALQGCDTAANVDATEIEKVVNNLVLNAQQASQPGAPVIISVGSDRTAFIEVADQGSGMSEEFIKNRLFQPFQTTKAQGLGIGLYQCRQIVESHGGKIVVASKVGEGTTFKMNLPVIENS